MGAPEAQDWNGTFSSKEEAVPARVNKQILTSRQKNLHGEALHQWFSNRGMHPLGGHKHSPKGALVSTGWEGKNNGNLFLY